MGISRFNGLWSHHHVCAFVLSLLDSPDLSDTESRKSAEQESCSVCILLPRGVRRQRGHLPQSNYVNADHVNALIDLPTAFSIEKAVQLLKGSSSHWTNSNHIITGKFAWGRGYGALSITHSNVDVVMRYIADQEEHHRQRTFTEELREFIDRHGLR